MSYCLIFKAVGILPSVSSFVRIREFRDRKKRIFNKKQRGSNFKKHIRNIFGNQYCFCIFTILNSCKMELKPVYKTSDFHKYIEKCVRNDFDDIEFENGKSIVMAVLDETDNASIYTKGSEDDVTHAICELFHHISKKDSGLFCEAFAEMLSQENAENLYTSIRNRADFDSFHEEDPETEEEIPYKTINDAEYKAILNGDFTPFYK